MVPNQIIYFSCIVIDLLINIHYIYHFKNSVLHWKIDYVYLNNEQLLTSTDMISCCRFELNSIYVWG